MAANDFNALARKMVNRGLEISEGVLEAMRIAAATAQKVAAEETPVDTGLARSNWAMWLNGKPPARPRPYVPGKHLGKGETVNLAAVQKQGSSVLMRAKVSDRIMVNNSARHIGKLNRGGSKQSPGGFLAKAVLIAKLSIRDHKVFSDSGNSITRSSTKRRGKPFGFKRRRPGSSAAQLARFKAGG